jgi:glycosyltransferase involved in cell wall biosynthesis
MEKFTLVSVIVPVFNVENYLEKCVNSILTQSYRNIELILVNDGSTDNSGFICDALAKNDSRISVIHQANGGSSVARNTGMDKASGEFIWFVDSDDAIAPGAVELCCEFAVKNSLDIVFFDIDLLSEIEGDNISFDRRLRGYDIASGFELVSEMFKYAEYIHSPCLIFIRRCFLMSNNLKFVPNLLYEDVLFTYSCLSAAKRVGHIHKKLYFYLQREGSMTNQKINKESVESYIYIAKYLFNECKLNQDVNIKKSKNDFLIFELMFSTFANRFDEIQGTELLWEVVSEVISFLEFLINEGILDSARLLKKSYKKIIQYAYGIRGKLIADYINANEIWDREAAEHAKPDFDSLNGNTDTLVVVCLDKLDVFMSIKAEFDENNFSNVCHWLEYQAHNEKERLLNILQNMAE